MAAQLPLLPSESRSSTRFAPILKASEDFGFVLAAPLVPDEVDLQGDSISAEEIEKTAYDFMEESQIGNFMHRQSLPGVVLVENTILRADTTINGVLLKAGTWLQGWKIYNPELRELIKQKKITGLSIEGFMPKESA
jgi:hypothetical protein